METNGNRNDAKWDAFEEMMENKVVFTVPIDESVKAGVVTSLKGVRAFIPASQLSTSYVEDVSEWIGKEVDVVIITADREKQRLVLSGREAAKIKRSQEKKARIDSLQVGTVLEGKVETIKPYGAFVDLGNGISGLVHISQMSTKRVATPEEVCKEGDTVIATVKNTDELNDGQNMKTIDYPTFKYTVDANKEAGTTYDEESNTITVNVQKVEVLPYHTMGAWKWKMLGIPYPLEGVKSPTEQQVREAEKILGAGAPEASGEKSA